jgi:DNA-binding beta-propeller fold protein YncE
MDGGSGAIMGRVALPGANGVAVVPSIGKGYAGSRESKSVVIFDLTTFKKLKELPAGEDTDGVVFDDFSKRIFVMEGDPHRITVVDTGKDSVVTNIALGGKPEFAAVDGAGKLFVNVTEPAEVQRIDTRSATIDATWSVAGCERPHGMSIDAKHSRLFVTCINSLMMVVDSKNGRVVAKIPIGKGSDAAAFDPNRGLAFSSNGAGTLSVVREDNPDTFTATEELPTQPLARTMAVDPLSGRLYLIAADRIEIDAKATDPRKRFAVKPGTTRVLFLDPGSPKQ